MLHLELAPQPFVQGAPVRSWFIDPDRSRRMRMSGGTLVVIGFVATQVTLASDSNVLLPSPFPGRRTSTVTGPASILISSSEALLKLHATGKPATSKRETKVNERFMTTLRKWSRPGPGRISIRGTLRQG